MSAHAPSKGAVLLKAVGAAALLGVARAATGGRRPPRDPREEAYADMDAEKRRDLATYGIGYVLALALTGLAFAVVTWGWAAGTTALGIVFALALVQAIVHFRCFLHIDLRRSHRDDLQLILFSSLIVCLMVGGTLVVLFNLRMRMM
ncbi:cytochrome o ubiquinol oxidase operon protein cyoD [Methylobacterium sp. UNC300MFChir4.1]|jgi:cytochrome o ubiquinol oxidase operon protein cyoD|uniref:cytochrome o ubiquinol oxidase subunit IV n=1 Tax=Methylobacterium sp. UNC300MFChir4.1 TaxID=1502747 RepID=UPI0008C29F59|nr:cytochrome C oxidase subunit IV family protein [Methylobacterium sp. UNC300MFChir4.1]SEO73914.1 cytochrome o ubiquinol oxidase operon protein cyoD [Methylobacterium sp. UNC300MFChir4.1]